MLERSQRGKQTKGIEEEKGKEGKRKRKKEKKRCIEADRVEEISQYNVENRRGESYRVVIYR